jgi:rubrerythrin
MEWRLFFSTFALVFLAELGDKTQLASMALSAGSKSPLSVFVGAASALILSALLAVLLGSTLQRVVPPRYLQVGASILFLVFGTVLLVSALRPRAAAAEKEAVEEAMGPVARLILRAALDFEKSTSADYRRLAQEAHTEALRELFDHLADEEDEHAAHIHALSGEHGSASWQAGATPHSPPAPVGKVAHAEQDLDATLRAAIQHEKNTAAFYRALARTAPLPSIRTALTRLAVEEDSHLTHLEEMAREGRTQIG